MSFFRRAMDYLGLSGDEGYDDYDMSMEYERPQRAQRGPSTGPVDRRGYEPEYSSETQRPAPRQRPDDTGAVRRPDDSGIQVRPVGAPRNAPSANVRPVPSQSDTVTVRPRNFNQAQEIADNFKDGVPVIVNLEGADREMARRVIDFASGLCYALGGSMEKVAKDVYMLKPAVSFDQNRY